MKKIFKSPIVTRTLDVLFSPLTLVASLWFRFCRMLKPDSMPLTEAIFMKTGILPVRDHYYQPLINPKKHLTKSLREDRNLPGIDWNIEEQLNLLEQFHFTDELLKIPADKTEKLEFYYNNNSYLAGDAEYLYNIIRLKQPLRIIEIGCGYSTLMIQQAIKANQANNAAYSCVHTCVEPYEMPWLEKLSIEVIRKRVEELPGEFFTQLEQNDILFIDSSHIIRPQGDILFEFLEILPILNTGVLVHVHDVFSPKDYLDEWVYSHVLWNEQYLLEAFLTFNHNYKITGALNFLKHHHFTEFARKCPMLAQDRSVEPGAFWMQKK
jgi:predicted O-methyltransferase YrrM